MSNEARRTSRTINDDVNVPATQVPRGWQSVKTLMQEWITHLSLQQTAHLPPIRRRNLEGANKTA